MSILSSTANTRKMKLNLTKSNPSLTQSLQDKLKYQSNGFTAFV